MTNATAGVHRGAGQCGGVADGGAGAAVGNAGHRIFGREFARRGDGTCAAFRKGLSEKSYVEGSNVTIEYRFAYNDFSRYRELASDLVRRRVAVIAVGASGPAARAAKEATATIPIVFGTAGDPVQEGLVDSFNRPGGNATGFTNMAAELTAKRLGLLHQMLPSATRFAVLVNNALNPNGAAEVTRVAREAASTIGKQIEVVSVSTSQEIEAAFAGLVDAKIDALVVPPSPLFTTRRAQLVTLATHHRMPAIYYDRPYAEAGGLMSYGASLTDQARQVGVYAASSMARRPPTCRSSN
jgi:putative ABC transport system substrate-binding protein